ncbi:MAG TPA: VUT family protein [Pyrinomonadaceae bacterium]
MTANLVVAAFGPAALPVTAFLLIPFDLCARDLLHERWGGRRLRLKMGALISTGSLLSYVVQPGSGRVAVASALAFGTAAVIDTAVYHLARRRSRLVRMNLSNACAAIIDSAVFPVVAFGSTTLALSGSQAGAKFFGGLFWSAVFVWLLRRRDGREMKVSKAQPGEVALLTCPSCKQPGVPAVTNRPYKFCVKCRWNDYGGGV